MIGILGRPKYQVFNIYFVLFYAKEKDITVHFPNKE